VRQAHCVTFDGRLRDATEELEELGGTDDCVWSGRVLDEAVLRKFGAEITAVEQALGSDNREGDVMLDAGGASAAARFLPAVWKKSIAA
jgi:hypothetical protein